MLLVCDILVAALVLDAVLVVVASAGADDDDVDDKGDTDAAHTELCGDGLGGDVIDGAGVNWAPNAIAPSGA